MPIDKNGKPYNKDDHGRFTHFTSARKRPQYASSNERDDVEEDSLEPNREQQIQFNADQGAAQNAEEQHRDAEKNDELFVPDKKLSKRSQKAVENDIATAQQWISAYEDGTIEEDPTDPKKTLQYWKDREQAFIKELGEVKKLAGFKKSQTWRKN